MNKDGMEKVLRVLENYKQSHATLRTLRAWHAILLFIFIVLVFIPL